VTYNPTLPLLFMALLFMAGLGWASFRAMRPGRAGPFLRAVGWVALCALPAAIGQGVVGAIERRADVGEVVAGFGLLGFMWVVMLGGWSVQGLFEATASSIGPRQVTMNPFGWYLALTAVQTLVLAVVVAARLRRRSTLLDPVVLLVGALVLANAIAGTRWPWWGT
jgi:hypothetical protein